MALTDRLPQLPLTQDDTVFVAVDPLPLRVQVRRFRTAFYRDAWVLSMTAWIRCSARPHECPPGVLTTLRRLTEMIEREGGC